MLLLMEIFHYSFEISFFLYIIKKPKETAFLTCLNMFTVPVFTLGN